MTKIDEAAILKRAKENCERNGLAWDVGLQMAQPGWPKNNPVLNDAARADYLKEAREQLLRERGE